MPEGKKPNMNGITPWRTPTDSHQPPTLTFIIYLNIMRPHLPTPPGIVIQQIEGMSQRLRQAGGDRIERFKGCRKKILPGGCAAGEAMPTRDASAGEGGWTMPTRDASAGRDFFSSRLCEPLHLSIPHARNFVLCLSICNKINMLFKDTNGLGSDTLCQSFRLVLG